MIENMRGHLDGGDGAIRLGRYVRIKGQAAICPPGFSLDSSQMPNEMNQHTSNKYNQKVPKSNKENIDLSR